MAKKSGAQNRICGFYTYLIRSSSSSSSFFCCFAYLFVCLFIFLSYFLFPTDFFFFFPTSNLYLTFASRSSAIHVFLVVVKEGFSTLKRI